MKFPPVFFFNLAFALAHYVNAMLWSKKRRKKNAAMLNQLMLVLTLVLLCGFEGKRWRVGLTELFTCLFLFFFVFAMCTCGLVDGTIKARCCRWFWCLQLKTELFIHVAATRTYTNAHTHTHTHKKKRNCLLWKHHLLSTIYSEKRNSSLFTLLCRLHFFFLNSLFFFFFNFSG